MVSAAIGCCVVFLSVVRSLRWPSSPPLYNPAELYSATAHPDNPKEIDGGGEIDNCEEQQAS